MAIYTQLLLPPAVALSTITTLLDIHTVQNTSRDSTCISLFIQIAVYTIHMVSVLHNAETKVSVVLRYSNKQTKHGT